MPHSTSGTTLATHGCPAAVGGVTPNGSSTTVLPAGGTLLEPEHAELLETLRRLMWSLMVDPRSGPALSPGTAGRVSVSLRFLAGWMIGESYRDFGQLDTDAFTTFESFLAAKIAGEDETDLEEDGPFGTETTADLPIEADENDEDDTAEDTSGLGYGSALNYVMSWVYLWRQRRALAEAGIPVPETNPLSGRRPAKIAAKIAAKANRWIPPLPDEVAIPVMQAANRLMGAAADDVIDLHNRYMARRGLPYVQWTREINEIVRVFEFSTLTGEAAPWHEPIIPHGENPRARALSTTQSVRDAVMAIRGAAVIVLQSAAGQRIGEICGIQAGIDKTTGVPHCIEIRRSKTVSDALWP